MVSLVERVFGHGRVDKADLLAHLQDELAIEMALRGSKIHVVLTDSLECGCGSCSESEMLDGGVVQIEVGTRSRDVDADGKVIDETTLDALDAVDLITTFYHELEHADLCLYGFGGVSMQEGTLAFESLEASKARMSRERELMTGASEISEEDRELRLALAVDRMLCRGNPHIYGAWRSSGNKMEERKEYRKNLNELVVEYRGSDRMGDFAVRYGYAAAADAVTAGRVNSKLFQVEPDKGLAWIYGNRFVNDPDLDYLYRKRTDKYFLGIERPCDDVAEVHQAFVDKIRHGLAEPYDLGLCVSKGSPVDELARIKRYGTPGWKACCDMALNEQDAAKQRRMLGAMALALHPEYAVGYGLSPEVLHELDFEGAFGRSVPDVTIGMKAGLAVSEAMGKLGIPGYSVNGVGVSGPEDADDLEPVNVFGTASSSSSLSAMLARKAQLEQHAKAMALSGDEPRVSGLREEREASGRDMSGGISIRGPEADDGLDGP